MEKSEDQYKEELSQHLAMKQMNWGVEILVNGMIPEELGWGICQ